jgi:sugar phosphate isomerase/epimerase
MSIKLCAVVSTPEVGPWPYGLLSGTFEEKIRKAAEMGYDGVELALRDVEAEDLAAIQGVLRDHGLAVPALVTGAIYGLDRLCLMSPDIEIERRAMARLKSFLELAGEYGAVVDIGLLRGHLSDMPDPEGAQDKLLETFRQAAEYAVRCGARITLEPLNRFESDFIQSAQDGLEWVARVDHPGFGLMLDSFHMNIEDASIEASVRQAAPCLWHIHVGDSNRLSAGKGHFDFAGMIQILKHVGYDGYMSAEHLPQPDPDRAARETLDHLGQYI